MDGEEEVVELRVKAQLMSASEIERTLVRLAHEVVEKNPRLEELALVGIERRGVPLARRLADKVEQITGLGVPVGKLDITLYRDDLTRVGEVPVEGKSELPFAVTGRNIIIVDDVLHTGRTARAALEGLFRHGRPARVQVLVLIDRGHRELPIEARYVGRRVETRENEWIEVQLREIDQIERVLLIEKGAAE